MYANAIASNFATTCRAFYSPVQSHWLSLCVTTDHKHRTLCIWIVATLLSGKLPDVAMTQITCPVSDTDANYDAPVPPTDVLPPLSASASLRAVGSPSESRGSDEISYLLSIETAMVQQMHQLKRLLDDFRMNSRQSPRHLQQKQSQVESEQPRNVAPKRRRTRVIHVSLRLPSREDRESVRQQLFDLALPPKAVLSLEAEAHQPFIWVGLPNERFQSSDPLMIDRWAPPFQRERSDAPEARCVNVRLDDVAQLEAFHSFSENTLYRLLHYDYGAVADDGNGNGSNDQQWAAYKAVNEAFAQAVSEIYEEGDLIWVHNHHLMLLPSMIRERLWYAKIGFFLYAAFPSAELFRILPMRTQILNGVLGADLVGFYSYDYSKQFVSACSSLLGLETTPSRIDLDPRSGRKCQIGIYPAGIDVKALQSHVSSKLLKTRVAELREKFSNLRLIVGVDRLDDCFAGIPLTLLAFQKLLKDNPDYVGKIVLVQVAMLPRESGRGYGTHRSIMTQINELVGEINASFGSFTFSPVHYINAEVSPAELHSLMCAGHVCIVSKVRDGMGLVPHEWTVCQHDGYQGPIVLSEFSGSARSFSTALHVNPWDVEEVALKLKEALEMDEKARAVRNEAAYGFASEHSAAAWGFNFLEDLENAEGAQHGAGFVAIPTLEMRTVLKAYKAASSMSAFSSPVASSTGLSALVETSSPFSMRIATVGIGPVSPAVAAQLSLGERSSDGDSGVAGMGSKKSSTNSLPGSTSMLQNVPSVMKRNKTKKKLFVIDYDGTLSGFQPLAEVSSPSGSVRSVISNILSACSDNIVLILSGRDRRILANWFGDLDVYLAAEDGCFFRPPGESWVNLCGQSTNRKTSMAHIDSYNDLMMFRDSSFQNLQHGAGDVDSGLGVGVNGETKKSGSGEKLNGSKEDSVNSYVKSSVSSIGSYETLDVDEMVSKWKGNVKQVMEHFAERTPGALLEEGDATLTFHYMDSDRVFGRSQARIMLEQLESFQVQNLNVKIVADEGRNRWLKVYPKGVNKAIALSRTIEHVHETGGRQNVEDDDGGMPRIDFILCIGDDRADECMFELLHNNRVELGINGISKGIFTCRVGSTATTANTWLETPAHVVDLLDELMKSAHGQIARAVPRNLPTARSAPS